MKSNTIVSGIWLIFIGLVVLLHNFDIIDFNFYAIIKLIPLLIIALGINLIVQNRLYGTYIIIAVNVAICAIFLIKGITTPRSESSSTEFFSKKISMENDDFNHSGQSLKTPYKNEEEVRLIFNGGGGNYRLDNKKITNLFEVASDNVAKGIDLSTTNSAKGKVIEVRSKGNLNSKDNYKNKTIQFTLHDGPIWDLEFNIGAADFNCDLSPYKIKNIEINSGATSMDLTFGLPRNGITKIEVSTAASSINIRIPKEAACSYKQESILSSKNIAGFDVSDGDTMKTANYDQATEKYEIELNGAANSFTLTRY